MRTLLVGNTGYITNDFIEEAFPEKHVFILGESKLKTDRRKKRIVRPFPESEDETEDIFHTYEFEEIVYFSNYLTFHGELEGEAEMLRKVLQYCKGRDKVHIVYLTGPDGSYDVSTGKTLLVSGAEEMCVRYASLYGMKVKIIRSLYLYSGQYSADYFSRIFFIMKEKGRIVFPEKRLQGLYFLSVQDLASLLYKVFDNWNEEEKYLHVPDVFNNTMQDLGDALKKLTSFQRVEYKESSVIEQIPADDRVIRYQYGWFPKISVLDELPEMYHAFEQQWNLKPGKMDTLRQLLKKHEGVLKITELILGFLVFQWLNQFVGNQAQFKMIDLRLVFIVLFGSLYGLNYGIAAAALETFSLLYAYESQGIGWYTLFYEPTNWIPFIFYFAVGVICGYVRMKNKENAEFVNSENKLLEEKFMFAREMYQETLDDKKMYKKQILGSEDSFGKIFDITRKLDIVQPQELFLETMHVMEEVLENKTFGFYTLNQRNGYGRLEMASSGMQKKYKNSVKLSEYRLAMDALEQGEVWVNKEFLDEYPMYLAGIRKNGELVMLVSIRDVQIEQMTLYYLNLFKILCGLIEASLLRALEYQEAIEYKQYIKGTHILKTEYFEERLKIQHDMREQRLASYELLELKHPEMSLEEADEILSGCVRENDIWGISEEGILYLILLQTDQNSLPIVLERLKRVGFICKQLDAQNENEKTVEEKV